MYLGRSSFLRALRTYTEAIRIATCLEMLVAQVRRVAVAGTCRLHLPFPLSPVDLGWARLPIFPALGTEGRALVIFFIIFFSFLFFSLSFHYDCFAAPNITSPLHLASAVEDASFSHTYV
jgi:hypothetical protein